MEVALTDKRLAKALRIRKRELEQQIAVIDETLPMFEPRPILPPALSERHIDRALLKVLGSEWSAPGVLAHKAGCTIRQAERRLWSLAGMGQCEHRYINFIPHYRQNQSWKLRLVAGEGAKHAS